MLNNEPKLLKEVLLYINGDLERIRHVLLMYTLTKVIAGCEILDPQQQQVTAAAAILLGLPVSSCKTLLICCGYVPSYQSDILELLSLKSGKQSEAKTAQKVLSEATLLADFIDFGCQIKMTETLLPKFKTESGASIFKSLIM